MYADAPCLSSTVIVVIGGGGGGVIVVVSVMFDLENVSRTNSCNLFLNKDFLSRGEIEFRRSAIIFIRFSSSLLLLKSLPLILFAVGSDDDDDGVGDNRKSLKNIK